MWDLVQPLVVLGFSVNNHIVERSGVHFPRGTMRVRDAALMDQLVGGTPVKIGAVSYSVDWRLALLSFHLSRKNSCWVVVVVDITVNSGSPETRGNIEAREDVDYKHLPSCFAVSSVSH